ncbi:hypothetical protein HN873_039141, partial [Arachis hypogaea]
MVRSQVLLLDPLPQVTRVFALIIQHERQLQVATGILDNPRSITSAVDSRHPSQGRGRSGFSSGKGRGGFSSGAECGGSSKFYTHCGHNGHTIEVCYSKHGYPPGHPRHLGSPHHSAASANAVVATPPLIALLVHDEMAALCHPEFPSPEYRDNVSSNQNEFLPSPSTHYLCSLNTFSILNNFSNKNTFLNSWIIDSGTTDHIASNLYWLISYYKVSPVIIHLPNNTKVTASYKGVVQFSSSLILHD